MRAVIQRVKRASVEVDQNCVSSIGPGWLCLIGITATDQAKDAEYVARKILTTRAWAGDGPDSKPWDRDVAACGYEVLLVSQFTLYGRLKKRKPDYSRAMAPAAAKEFYSAFVSMMQQQHGVDRVKDGVFGAMMDVSLVNDGPVTFIIDSELDIAGSDGQAQHSSEGQR